MANMVQKRSRSALKLTEKKVVKLDMSKVKIVALPRRNDDVYMRGVRRPRA